MYDPMQSVKSFELRGPWFRWSSYELRNGVIRPALATLEEYDPWQRYRTNVGKYRTVEQPYLALLELQRELERVEDRGGDSVKAGSQPISTASVIRAQNDADDLIVRWCNRHGLLGLLSTLSNSICFPAVVRPLTDYANTRVVSQEMYVRTGGIWHPVLDVRSVFENTSKRADAVARREAKELSRPGVTWFNRESSVYELKPLDSIKKFFPFSSKSNNESMFHPPCPNQQSFWADYGEPVSDFKLWCRLFTRAVEHLSQWPARSAGGDTEDLPIEVERSFRTLSELAQSAAPSFSLRKARGTIEEARESAGLLASYALMFLWDHIDGRRTLRCQNCGRYFVSNENRARYCCVSCRNTAQSRRYRTKKEENTSK